MTPEQVADLIERLERADGELRGMINGRVSTSAFDSPSRLEAKAEGVRLALSYVKEYV